MMFDSERLSLIRNTKMELHCLSIHIWQNKTDGLNLSGHGTIKQNKFGTLYLEFVCTQTTYKRKFDEKFTVRFPKDSLNQEEKLLAEFIDIEGTTWCSSDFKLELSMINLDNPKVINILLPHIKSEDVRDGDSTSSYMYLEFAEPIDIPFNKSNSNTSSSTGSESVQYNEAVIKLDNFTVRIVNEPEHRFIKVTGNFNCRDVERCLKFFLGFSCGVLPQPYVKFTNVRDKNYQFIRKRSVKR
jgi:hypothetical protein